MTFIVKLEKRDNYLRAQVEGEFALNKSINLFSVIINSCEANQINRILIDARKIEKKITVLERTFLGAYLRKEAKDEMKIAIIATKAQIQPRKVLEKYVVNRGLDLKVFFDASKAIQWLEP